MKSRGTMHECWMNYQVNDDLQGESIYKKYRSIVVCNGEDEEIITAVHELKKAIKEIFNEESEVSDIEGDKYYITLQLSKNTGISNGYDGFEIIGLDKCIKIKSTTSAGVLYGTFKLIQAMLRNEDLENIVGKEASPNQIRMVNHWDNISGDIERGYAGKSIFFKDDRVQTYSSRVKEYARLLASVGINALSINNVNVHEKETLFITETYLKDIAYIANIFKRYDIKVYLSINFAAPIEIGGLQTADPLDEGVSNWWKERVETIYKYIPNLGGFLVKADSENRPGPFTYSRNHAEGANMLADALAPFGGNVIWRCFVYNCHLDWRDRSKDRAKAAYDHFKPLDGNFKDNVILQIKNGPVDFQIREPLSPLFGSMKETNQMMEFQITAEYTGQQKHLCFLVPMWKECLDFDTYARGQGSYVKDIVSGEFYKRQLGGIAGVVNIGDSFCWTGSVFAQANLFGFGKLAWNPNLSAEAIAREWIEQTLGKRKEVIDVVMPMLLESRKVYEDYTVPLSIGFMVNPGYHYGPNIEGYEYSPWGTYHYADFKGIGVDRTEKTGTGYTTQYYPENRDRYERLETCPQELLLFFHHVPYDFILKDGRTLVQYIYDTHFEGVEKVEEWAKEWMDLEGKISSQVFDKINLEFDVQIRDAKEWRDVINTYFYRRTGVMDIKQRKIYP